MPPVELERCPDDNTLARLVAGELSDDARLAIERHLGRCEACAHLIAAYARTTPPRNVPARYALLRQLGAGGMGEVWEVEDTKLHRRVALKLVRAESSADRAFQARLVREARALARLHHPNVIAVHDLLETSDGELVLALELVDGVTARAWRSAKRRSAREIVALWCQVIDGLAAVHDAGIVHRDLKPDNVLVASDGRVVIGDFGLASLAAGRGSTTLTASGQIIGTPLYMPLEQLRGEDATPASDQFALCVCLWEALVGARPFGTGTTLAGLVRAMERPPVVPRHRERRLLAVLARGLDPDPRRRFRDVARLRAAITAAHGSMWSRLFTAGR